MIKLYEGGAYLVNGKDLVSDHANVAEELKQKYGVDAVDKEALAQNVYALAEVLEALLGGEEDGQEEPITEDTEG